jgi:hypothetical protein
VSEIKEVKSHPRESTERSLQAAVWDKSTETIEAVAEGSARRTHRSATSS